MCLRRMIATLLIMLLQVPTADNVMVDINLSLTFSIGPGAEAAEAFVYMLGCSRFDEFLSSEVCSILPRCVPPDPTPLEPT